MTLALRGHELRGLDECEMSASVLTPYFEACRDLAVENMHKACGIRPSACLVRKARLIVDPHAGGGRHYAMTHTESLSVHVAPDMVDLPEPTILGLFAHEFGHVADYAYPGSFVWAEESSADTHWIGTEPADKARAWRRFYGRSRATSRSESDDALPCANWMRAWEDRSDDEIEWTADAIALFLLETRVGYAGPCLLQTLGGGRPRPRGLR